MRVARRRERFPRPAGERVRAVDLGNLELPRLLEAVARYAASDAGREACRALAPVTSPALVREELARVGQFQEITEEEPAPLGSFPDIRPFLAVSGTPGARLSGRELLAIAATLTTVRQMRGFLRARGAGHPLLLAYLEALHPLPELDRLLSSTLDEEGEVRDNASPTLRALRRELRELRAEIERRLARLVRDGIVVGRGRLRHGPQRPLRRSGAGASREGHRRHRPGSIGFGRDAVRRAPVRRRTEQPAADRRPRGSRGGVAYPRRDHDGGRREPRRSRRGLRGADRARHPRGQGRLRAPPPRDLSRPSTRGRSASAMLAIRCWSSPADRSRRSTSCSTRRPTSSSSADPTPAARASR